MKNSLLHVEDAMVNRRAALGAAVAAGALTAGGLALPARAAGRGGKTVIVLVHGSWHGAWCFGKIIPRLVAAGHPVFAPDLPGHGLNARFPKSYGSRPLDVAKFGAEKSLIADATLADYGAAVSAAVDEAYAMAGGPVILLGHSMGGLPITLAGEARSEKIKKIVYLTAFMVPNNTSVGTFAEDPEGAGAKTGPVMLADPAATGALRIDPHSDDPAYVANLKAALAGDATDADFDAVRNLLTPDVPVGLFGTVVKKTNERWGKIPRAFIKCTEDYAIRPKLQEKFIALADAATPKNLTEVHVLNSSHSGFISKPVELSDILITLSA